MEPSSRGVAEGQEAGTATSLVCFCWVGVGHKSFCLQGLWSKEFPLHALSIHTRKIPLYPFSSSATTFSFHPQCLPSILPYRHDLQLVLMCFLGIDFHELRLVPILSVGAITIRLWIISLDHCFPLLCWLGAIHLPRPPESQPLLNCLSLSLLFPLFYPPPPQPQSHLMILICPPLHHSIYWKASWATAKASAECLQAIQDWGNPPCDSPILTHWPLPQQTDTWHILHVICERSHKMTNRDAISPQTAFHNGGWLGWYE